MFDLEVSIAAWRQQMLAARIQTPAPLEELEIHLREDIEGQMRRGSNAQQAFENSVQQIGQPEPLTMEFKKIGAEDWNRPLAWTAWTMFVLSFFLPAYADGFGWACAWLSLSAWRERPGNLFDIHLAVLTLGNLLMIISPFLLPLLSQNARRMKWLRGSCLVASLLVWSFVIRLAAGKDLRIGCYVWAISFLLLGLATFAVRDRKTFVAAANS